MTSRWAFSRVAPLPPRSDRQRQHPAQYQPGIDARQQPREEAQSCCHQAILKFLDGEAKDNADTYKEFYAKFSRFLKEGIVVDFEHRESLAKLLRFESSMTDAGTLTGFEDYITRAKDGQEKIYYLTSCGSCLG